MGQATRRNEPIRDYAKEAKITYLFFPPQFRSESGAAYTKLAEKIRDELGLDDAAFDGVICLIQKLHLKERSMRILYIGVLDAPPTAECNGCDGGFYDLPRWHRHGNVWLLDFTDYSGARGKTVVVIARIADPLRALLKKVDDYLSNRAGRPTQANLRREIWDAISKMSQP